MKNNIESAKKTNNSAAPELEEIDDSKQNEIVKVQGKLNLIIYFNSCFSLFLADKSRSSNAQSTATESKNTWNKKNTRKFRNLEVTPKMRQNQQKLKSKRDMSANSGAQRNKYTNEMLKLEKSGALNNLPKVWVDSVFQVKRFKFVSSYLEFDRIWYRRGDWKDEYLRKDQLKQNNKFIKSWKLVYDMNEKSPYYTDPNKPYIDEK